MKKHIGIIGIVIAIIGFSIYYPYAYSLYDSDLKQFIKPLNNSIAALNYVPLMLSLAFLSLELYFSSTGNKKKLFGFNTVFWGGVGIAYLFRDVLHIIPSKLFIIIIAGLWLVFGLVLYFIRSK